MYKLPALLSLAGLASVIDVPDAKEFGDTRRQYGLGRARRHGAAGALGRRSPGRLDRGIPVGANRNAWQAVNRRSAW